MNKNTNILSDENKKNLVNNNLKFKKKKTKKVKTSDKAGPLLPLNKQ